jgi:hypothetical protein
MKRQCPSHQLSIEKARVRERARVKETEKILF